MGLVQGSVRTCLGTKTIFHSRLKRSLSRIVRPHPQQTRQRSVVGASNVFSALGTHIPVRTTSNLPSEIGAFVRADEFDGGCDKDAVFAQCVKKKPKRYYQERFLPSITEEKVAQYANKRGPTVTFIRIWHSRRKANNVVIRLNVEDNGFADWVVSSTFWPRGVTCRPWFDRNERIGSVIRLPMTRAGDIRIRSRYIYGRSDIDDYNPYSPLRDRVNMD